MTSKYECDTCGTHDPEQYVRCDRPDCPDGRDSAARAHLPAFAQRPRRQTVAPDNHLTKSRWRFWINALVMVFWLLFSLYVLVSAGLTLLGYREPHRLETAIGLACLALAAYQVSIRAARRAADLPDMDEEATK